MNDISERFLNNGIPYSSIDKEMVEIIDVFNFHLGLKTKYCCYGHEPFERSSVIFDESVTDEAIMKLAEKTAPFISYNKWVRHHPVKVNWTCSIGMGYKNPNSDLKLEQLSIIVEMLKGKNI